MQDKSERVVLKMRQGRNGEEDMFKSWFLSLCLYSYLSDDLAILSMDLSNASPLCQEGEDLIQLKEEDRESVKLQWLCFCISCPAQLFTQNQDLL